MKKLIEKLLKYQKEYDEGYPSISDKEFDELYFKLKEMEIETGIIYPNSPTQKIIYESVSELTKVKHNHPMLSLDKTKDIQEVEKWMNNIDDDYLIMAKMDGLTLSVRYLDGKLVSAETRGDGEVGEDVLHNAKIISNLPKTISYKDELIIDGEIIITYEDFEAIKGDYKNPRNLASGSIRLLDNNIAKERKLKFIAWKIIKGFSKDKNSEKLITLQHLGFDIVPYLIIPKDEVKNIEYNFDIIKDLAKALSYPIDGCVVGMDTISKAEKMGATAHHINSMLAFKFYDEEYETKLIDIEWSLGRTGVLTPVAIVETVEIDGTEVNRASLHNVSIMRELLGDCPHKNQKVKIIKSNMIIPQIVSADKETHGTLYYYENTILELPEECPICGGKTKITDNTNVLTLVCTNPNCEGKIITKIDHFCSKKGMDIKGLSRARIEKIMNAGLLNDIEDIFILKDNVKKIENIEGFGEASVKNIINAIEEARHCDLKNFISAIGIPEVGMNVAKVLENEFKTWSSFRAAVDDNNYSFASIDTIGFVMNNYIKKYNYEMADKIVENYIIFNNKEIQNNQSLSGKVFVITGKLKGGNRDSYINKIESAGGKVSSSVSNKTDYLVNNDINSTSAKNKKAKELNIPIITEEQLNKML